MRPVRLVCLYLAVVFIGGALLAPWIFKLVDAGSHVLPMLRGLAGKPFPRYVSRSFLVMALLGLVPFLRAAELGSWREVGLPRKPFWWRDLTLGFALGLVSLACLVFLALN